MSEDVHPKTPLQMLEAICDEIADEWDRGMKAGKLLYALTGKVPNYREDVTIVRKALLTQEPAP